MKKFIVASVALASLSACGSRNSDEGFSSSPPYTHPPTIPIVPPVVPDFDQDDEIIFRYQPAFLKYDWIFSEFAEMPRELAPAADDLYRFWESWRKSWGVDLNHGHVPETYLSMIPRAPEHIRYVDNTNGDIPGLDKMPIVLKKAFERCPSLNESELHAPLEVRWSPDKDIVYQGRFFEHYLKLTDENGLKLRSNSQFYPAISIKASESEEVRNETFIHEYGHFIQHAWSLNSGRSMVQSHEYAEFIAELVRHLCFGSILEKPGYASKSVEQGSWYGQPFDSFFESFKTPGTPNPHMPYSLGSVEKLIMWEIHNYRLEPNEMFKSMIKTILQMKGRKLDSYPAHDMYGNFLSRAPWASDDSEIALKDQPVMFTRSEFLELFCNNYDCNEMEYLIAAEAEGKAKAEW